MSVKMFMYESAASRCEAKPIVSIFLYKQAWRTRPSPSVVVSFESPKRSRRKHYKRELENGEWNRVGATGWSNEQ